MSSESTSFLGSTTGKIVIASIAIGGVILVISFSPLGKALGATGDALEWGLKKGIPGAAKELTKAGKSLHKNAIKPAYKDVLKPAYKKGIKPAAKAIAKAGKDTVKETKKAVKSVKKATKKFKKGVKKLFK